MHCLFGASALELFLYCRAELRYLTALLAIITTASA